MAKQTEIYIGANEIQAVEYSGGLRKVVITGFHTYKLPEGCVINGLIMDEEAFSDAAEKFASGCRFKLNKARLLVDSGQIMLKSLAVPDKMRRKQILYAVRAELTALDSKKEAVYEYSEIKPRRDCVSRDVLCCGMDKELLEQYQAAFARANVKIGGIHLVPGCIMHVAEQVQTFCEGTVILCVLDGQTAVTYLFANGAYITHSRNRLLASRGDERMIGELLERISTMDQFSQSQRDFEKVCRVCFCGLDLNEAKGCQIVRDTLGLEVETFSLQNMFRLSKNVSELPWDSLFSVLAAVLPSRRKDVDFLSALKKDTVDTLERKEPRGVFLVCLASCIAAMIGAWGVVMCGNYLLNQQIREARLYTEEPQNIEKYRNALDLKGEILMYDSAIQQVQSAAAIVGGSRQPDGSMLDFIETAAGEISCMDYQYFQENEQLSFQCMSKDYRSIPGFIRELKESEFIRGVSYTGYAYDENAGQCRFSITAHLAKPKGVSGNVSVK